MPDHGQSDPQERNGAVLIVDDETANLQLLSQILLNAGYTVRAAASGRLALRSIEHVLPDLVLLDVRMPQLDGIEVCRRIRTIDGAEELPVIFVSSSVEPGDKVRAFGAGGVDYITKPFDNQEVLARVSTHLRLRELQEALDRRNRYLGASNETNETLEARVHERTVELERANVGLKAENKERRRVEAALRESTSSLEQAQAVAHVGSWRLCFDDNSLSWTDEAYRIFDVDPGNPVSYETFLDCVHPEDRERVDAAWRGALNGRSYDVEHRVCTRGGIKWVHERALFEYDNEGKRCGAIGMVHDITRQKEAELQRRLMMDELDHRVKNNLSAVLALAQQTALMSGSLSDFEGRFVPRIMSMARAHELLALKKWAGIRLDEALDLIVKPYADVEHGRIMVEGPEVHISAQAAMPLCLALHELTANALKHGSLRWSRGSLEISWALDDEGNIRLGWDEHVPTGGKVEDEVQPVSVAPAGAESGIGFSLIRGFIEHELGGTIEMDIVEEGLRCRVMLRAHLREVGAPSAVKVVGRGREKSGSGAG